MYTTLLTSIDEGICIITINRPDKLNALNKTVLDELEKAIQQLYTDKQIRAAIITGAGSKAFIAGADITEFTQVQDDEGAKLAKRGQDIFFQIENAPKPIVCRSERFSH